MRADLVFSSSEWSGRKGHPDGGFRGLLPLEKTNLRAQRRDLILFSRRALPRREETAETEEENG